MEKLSKEQEIIKILFKDFLNYYNSRNISKVVGMSHVGAFKILKKLEKREIVLPKKIGKAVVYSLNMNNSMTLREIEMALTIESLNHKKWVEEFKEIAEKSNFIILFGSILRNEKEAHDIDLLVVAEKSKFDEIKKMINKKNLLLNKNIHPLFQLEQDFKQDIKNKNKVIIEALKTGIVLSGQENLTKILVGEI